MIATLQRACIKQNQNIPFGPVDIGGSFMALVKRGLITNESVTIHGRTQPKWMVSPEAYCLLKDMGIDIPEAIGKVFKFHPA